MTDVDGQAGAPRVRVPGAEAADEAEIDEDVADPRRLRR